MRYTMIDTKYLLSYIALQQREGNARYVESVVRWQKFNGIRED